MRRRADVVFTANSVEEAWGFLRQSAVPIDRALIDADLPGDSALTFASELRIRYPEVGIVMSVDSALDVGFGQLLKPYALHELWAAIA